MLLVTLFWADVRSRDPPCDDAATATSRTTTTNFAMDEVAAVRRLAADRVVNAMAVGIIRKAAVASRPPAAIAAAWLSDDCGEEGGIPWQNFANDFV